MEFIRGLGNIKKHHRGCAVTIGNYDGVHRGHQTILRRLRLQAKEMDIPSLVVIFEPQPKEFFLRDKAPPRLMRLREKCAMLSSEGIDFALCLRFDQRLADLPPAVFVRDLLITQLGIRYLIVGEDFRFGARQAGGLPLLRLLTQDGGYGLETMTALHLDDRRISSTVVRQALLAGNLRLATDLLGHPYFLMGRVVKGDGRGKKLGFPTINLFVPAQGLPVAGVFCVLVHGAGPLPWRGVANVGLRPTVNGEQPLLEVHLLDFSGDLYGRQVRVEFLQRLRDEVKFDSLEQLTAQLRRDEAEARRFFCAD